VVEVPGRDKPGAGSWRVDAEDVLATAGMARQAIRPGGGGITTQSLIRNAGGVGDQNGLVGTGGEQIGIAVVRAPL